MMAQGLAVLIVTFWFIPFSAHAACIFGGSRAEHNPSYNYAVAYIESIYTADVGLKRISAIAKALKPAENDAQALASFSEMLKNYELAARDFECAALIIEPQEKFSPARSNEFATRQMEMGRTAARAARVLYLELAKETRAIASILIDRMKGSLGDIDFAERSAKVSANLHDLPRELFSLTPAVPHILVDPKPDSANRMSRLGITAKQRDDLIAIIDSRFGKRAAVTKKADQPALEASAAMIRQWLATTGHTPLP